jgi:hypothetical protein
MATFRGISAVGTSVLSLLDDAWSRGRFEATTLETKLVRSDELAKRPFEFGVSLFVYHVAVNGTQRTLPPAAPHHRRPLPVEVSFIVTPWAGSAQRELELLGWCMRALDEVPVLPPALLNAAVPGVFAPNEVVEVVPAQLPPEQYFSLWETLPFEFQLSMAYAARLVRLESELQVTEAGPVLERELDFGMLVGS